MTGTDVTLIARDSLRQLIPREPPRRNPRPFATIFPTTIGGPLDVAIRSHAIRSPLVQHRDRAGATADRLPAVDDGGWRTTAPQQPSPGLRQYRLHPAERRA